MKQRKRSSLEEEEPVAKRLKKKRASVQRDVAPAEPDDEEENSGTAPVKVKRKKKVVKKGGASGSGGDGDLAGELAAFLKSLAGEAEAAGLESGAFSGAATSSTPLAPGARNPLEEPAEILEDSEDEKAARAQRKRERREEARQKKKSELEKKKRQEAEEEEHPKPDETGLPSEQKETKKKEKEKEDEGKEEKEEKQQPDLTLAASSSMPKRARAKREAEERGNAVNPKREKKVFLRGFPWSVDEETLHADFSKFGEIEHIQYRRDHKGRPEGSAYVEYKDPESATKVLHLHGIDYKGRNIKVTRRSPRRRSGRRVRRQNSGWG